MFINRQFRHKSNIRNVDTYLKLFQSPNPAQSLAQTFAWIEITMLEFIR